MRPGKKPVVAPALRPSLDGTSVGALGSRLDLGRRVNRMITRELALRLGLDCQEHGRVCQCAFWGAFGEPVAEAERYNNSELDPHQTRKYGKDSGVPAYGMKNKTHTKPYTNYSCLERNKTHTHTELQHFLWIF